MEVLVRRRSLLWLSCLLQQKRMLHSEKNETTSTAEGAYECDWTVSQADYCSVATGQPLINAIRVR
jgi:hypothetical protein